MTDQDEAPARLRRPRAEPPPAAPCKVLTIDFLRGPTADGRKRTTLALSSDDRAGVFDQQ